MLKYLATTTLILLWCLLLSGGWAVVAYEVGGRRRRPGGGAPWTPLLPALVLAPLALVAGFRLGGVSLVYPVALFADAWDLVRAALPPALVLLVASGLGGSLWQQIGRETEHWRGKTFTLVALATGKSAARQLRRLVLVKALSACWGRALPWLFGELVVVEAIFNAPGLGLDAWHRARIQDYAGLASNVAQLAALYALSIAIAAAVHARLGRRLESYG